MSFFDSTYVGTPPWDIGRPQPEIVRLARAKEIRGSVVDVGCGTGENVLFLAELGHEAVGVDLSTRAIEKARQKEGERRLPNARFTVGDALNLEELGEQFDCAIDCGFFHTLSDEMRAIFTKSLASVLRTGGTYFMLCFSDEEPRGWGGPRRVTRDEIKNTFGKGWKINYIRPTLFQTNLKEIKGRAWLASISKL